MVDNFDVNSLTDWGERIFNGEDGIAQTARGQRLRWSTAGAGRRGIREFIMQLLSALLGLLPG